MLLHIKAGCKHIIFRWATCILSLLLSFPTFVSLYFFLWQMFTKSLWITFLTICWELEHQTPLSLFQGWSLLFFTRTLEDYSQPTKDGFSVWENDFSLVNLQLHIGIGPQREKKTLCIMKWMLFWNILYMFHKFCNDGSDGEVSL